MSDIWNWIEDAAGDAKDWVEEQVDDAEDWIEEKTSGTPLAGLWDKAEDLLEDRAWGFVEDTIGERPASVIGDVYHGRTEEAVSTVADYVDEETEGTTAGRYLGYVDDAIDVVREGPQAVAGAVTELIGDEVEDTWFAGAWGSVGGLAGGLIAGAADKAGDALEGTVVEEGFGAMTGIADMVSAEEPTDATGAPEPVAGSTDGDGEAPPSLADAAAGRGIAPDAVLRAAVEPIDGGQIPIGQPAPLGDALAKVPQAATDPQPVEETAIPAVVGAPAATTDAPTPTDAVVPTVTGADAPAAEAPTIEEAAAAEVAPAPEPTTFESSIAEADASEASVDDLFTDLG